MKSPAYKNTNTFLFVIWPQVTFPDFNVKTADKAHWETGVSANNEKTFIMEG